MGVPIDRGLTHFVWFSSIDVKCVEMGVPIDRGLTRFAVCSVCGCFAVVEMGVPIDRGLTRNNCAIYRGYSDSQ